MITPTDGAWMSAKEALEYLRSRGVNAVDAISAICTHAHAGLVAARAKTFICNESKRRSEYDVPDEFWWAEGGGGAHAGLGRWLL